MTVSRNLVEVVIRYRDVKGGLPVYASLVLERMTGNSYFPNPVIPLSELSSAIDGLRTAAANAEIGGPAERAIRNEKKRELLSLLKLLAAWVEYVANKHPDIAVSMVESSGFDVKRSTHPQPKELIRIVEGDRSGEVIIYVKMPKKDARIHYQMSADGRVTWVDIATIHNSKYEVSGLTPGKTYSFRFLYMLQDNVLRPGCDPVDFMVR